MPVNAMISRYDEFMDPECVPICDALNLLPGIVTFESCWGHGKNPFFVAFRAGAVVNLRPLLIAIHGEWDWKVEAVWANGGDVVYFTLNGPVNAVRMANVIAVMIVEEFRRR